MTSDQVQSVADIFTVIPAHENISAVIRKVIDGSIIGCEIANFFDEEHCDALVKTVEKYAMDSTYLSGSASKILESQHNRQSEPEAYFHGANSHPLLAEPLFKYSEEKLLTVLGKSQSDLDVGIAYDVRRQSFYCPAIIREFHSTLKLHNDLGSREGLGWDPIERVQRQWAFVIKLSQCQGGATYVYDRRWEEMDQAYFNAIDNYSYDMKVVQEAAEVKVEGQKGSLIIFDCTCYHRVDQVLAGRRYTMGGFIGLLEDEQRLIVWS